MVKFIHCADIHILGGFKGAMPPGPASRLEALNLEAFTELLDDGVREGAAFVVISGDLFEAGNMDLKGMEDLSSIFKQHKKLHFYLTAGNKDEFFEKSWYDLYEFPANVTLFRSRFDTVDKGAYTVSGFSLYKGDKGADLSTLKLPADKVNIVSLHCNIAGVTPAYPYYNVDFEALAAKRVDYIAAGHVHRHASGKLSDRTTYGYPGSLVPRSFEENHAHGYIKGVIDGGKVKTEFVEVKKAACHDITLDLTGAGNAAQQEKLVVERALKLEKGAIVRMTLTGSASLSDMLSERAITHKVRDRFLYFELVNRIGLSEAFLKSLNGVSLPGSFVHVISERDDLEEEDRQMILKYGLKALRAEESDL